MNTLNVYDWEMKDAIRIPARRTRWCAKCGCYHEYHFFWRRKGLVKSCGKQFKKGLIGVKTS